MDLIWGTHLRFAFVAGISNAVPFGTCIWLGTVLIDCCFCWIWLCVGIITLSVSESRRELFAVDVAVPGLSRPPELLVALSNCWLLMIECCCKFSKRISFFIDLFSIIAQFEWGKKKKPLAVQVTLIEQTLSLGLLEGPVNW